MTKYYGIPKCKIHGDSHIAYEEQPESSPHKFKVRCTLCTNGFITWMNLDRVEEIAKEKSDIKIVPRLTSTFNNLFE